jgi:hypothetical protein
MTLACIMRLMPATPMADSRPPMVVGIRHTSSAISTVALTTAAAAAMATAKAENGHSVTMTSRNRGQAHQQDGQRHSFGLSGAWPTRPWRSCDPGTTRRG